MQEYNDAMSNGRVNAAKELSQAEVLLRAATDESRAMDQRREAAEKMQQLYPDYLGNMSTEAIMAGNAADAYAALSTRLIEVAQSRAAMSRLAELAAAKTSPELEAVQKAQAEYEAAIKKRDEYLKTLVDLNGYQPGQEPVASAYAGLGNAKKALTEALAAFSEKYGVAGDNIIEINEAIAASEQKLIESVTAFDEVGAKPTTITPQTDILGRGLLLQAMREFEDEQLAIMADGYEKRREQARVQFERQLRDIQEQKQKLLKADRAESGGANAAKINTLFDARTFAVFSSYRQALADIEAAQQAEATKVYQSLLRKYETYLQKRERLIKEYDADINALAASPDNQRQAEAAKAKALQDLDVAFADQFPQFEQWANSIVTLSIEKLRELLAVARAELETLEASGTGDGNSIAKANAAVAVLQNALGKAQQRPIAPTENDVEKWSELTEVLSRAGQEFARFGDDFDGTVADILSSIGEISTSVVTAISGIEQLADSSVKAVQGSAEAGKQAISGLEKTSIILSVASAVFSVFRGLSALFSATETEQEKNLRLAKEFNDELLVMQQRAQINKDDNSIFGDAVYANFKRNVAAMQAALKEVEEDKKALQWRGFGLPVGQITIRDWGSVERSVANMAVKTRSGNWFRSAKYASLKDLVPELFGDDGQIDMEALKAFADESNSVFQGLSAHNKELIKSLVDDWETYEAALDGVRDYLASIFGDLGDTMMDSMLQVADGLATSEDAMASMMTSAAFAFTKHSFVKV